VRFMASKGFSISLALRVMRGGPRDPDAT
jgi:hypothetical protein